MPELPEVETVLRTLEHKLKGQKILGCQVFWDNIIAYPTVFEFEKRLVNQRFNSFKRRGKYLLFELDDYYLISHLRMEGKYFIYENKQEKNKHDHVIFQLDKCFVHYNDTRKFGKFYLYQKNEELAVLKELGKEPFDESLTGEYLKAFNKNNNQYIKTALLNQNMIAGIGNIYADEILFTCKINPKRRSKYLSIDKWNEIISATRLILSKAIQAGGTTIRSYTSSLGVTGRFQLNLKVHSKEKQPCEGCGNIISKIILNTRGCNYCENCQKDESIKIAITGSIGSGKSTLLHIIEKLGFKVANCDKINHELLQEMAIKEVIAKILKCEVEELNNAYIANKIYNDCLMKKQIEEYLHGKIYERIIQFYQENKDEKIVFVEVPLLFETNYYQHFDYNILIKTSEDVLIKRLKESRKMKEEDIKLILSKQMAVSEKEKKADWVIENNQDAHCLEKKMIKKINEILKEI